MSTATTKQGLCDECECVRGPKEEAPRARKSPRDRLRSPLGLSRAVVVLLGLVIATDLAVLCFQGIAPLLGTGPELPAQETGVPIWETLQFNAFLLTGVVFLVWFHRVRVNAGVLAPDGHRGGVGWAIASWFIPIANLWIPRGVAVDIWNASAPRTAGSPGSEPHRRVVNAWWAAWLCSGLLDGLASAVREDAATPDALRIAAVLIIAASLVDIAAALLAMRFVRRLTAMQQAATAEHRKQLPAV